MRTKSQLKVRNTELANELDKATEAHEGGRLDAKRYRGIVDRLCRESDDVRGELKAHEQAARYAGGTEVVTGGVVGGMPGVLAPGQTNQCLQSPMQLAPDQVNTLVRAFETKTPVTVAVQTKGGWQSSVEFKSPVTESGLATALPGVEMPNKYMAFPYEPTRIAAYLPGAAMSGPSAFWLSETAHANEAAVTIENTGKPDLSPTLVNNEVLPMKIAGQFSVTLEMWHDYVGDIGGWLLQSLQRSIINKENSALLNAVQGTAGATFNGFLNTSGTLSQSASGMNGVDGIITAAAAMRSNSNGFASPDLLIASPNTVAQILMEKDNQGRYLNNIVYGGGPGGLTWNGGGAAQETTNIAPGGFVPQGANGGDLHLAGIPTVQTTQIEDGTAVMLSVRNGGGVYWTRLNMLIFFDPYTGLSNNTFRWVAETRVSLSVPRPAACAVISNLPA